MSEPNFLNEKIEEYFWKEIHQVKNFDNFSIKKLNRIFHLNFPDIINIYDIRIHIYFLESL